MVNDTNSSLFQDNRIRMRSSFFGVVITIAMFFFFLSAFEALGLWATDLSGAPIGDGRAFLATSLAWIIALFIGALCTVLSIRTYSLWNGLLNALAVWSGSYLLYIFLIGGFSVSFEPSSFLTRLFWNGFTTDVLSLASAAAGGIIGVRMERRRPVQTEISAHETVTVTEHAPSMT